MKGKAPTRFQNSLVNTHFFTFPHEMGACTQRMGWGWGKASLLFWCNFSKKTTFKGGKTNRKIKKKSTNLESNTKAQASTHPSWTSRIREATWSIAFDYQHFGPLGFPLCFIFSPSPLLCTCLATEAPHYATEEVGYSRWKLVSNNICYFQKCLKALCYFFICLFSALYWNNML